MKKLLFIISIAFIAFSCNNKDNDVVERQDVIYMDGKLFKVVRYNAPNTGAREKPHPPIPGSKRSEEPNNNGGFNVYCITNNIECCYYC